MTKPKLLAGLVLLIALAGITLFFVLEPVTEVRGVVRDSQGPVAGATVRAKTTPVSSVTDASGHFILRGFPPAFQVRVTAWKHGYYIAGSDAFPWKQALELALTPYLIEDNPSYSWVLPSIEDRSALEEALIQTSLSLASKLSFNRLFLPLASRLTLGCRDCHGKVIYDQWNRSAHAQSATNPRFLNMYNGTDAAGHRSPLTRHVFHKDYGRIPIPASPDEPYYGPGYKLDFPDTAGNCATCHAPAAALEAPYATDMNRLSGVAAQGSSCDFCHKIYAARLDPVSGLPQKGTPGVLSLELRRPSPEPQLFFGPYDDVDVGPDSYLPLQKESQICASCHNASFWGTPIYQSFAEWLDSPYPEKGKSCQSCHMKPDDVTTNFAPGRGGLERDPETIPTHSFPGAADEELLTNTATLEVRAWQQERTIQVEVMVTNSEAGHHIPTDHPMRHILLLVKATDARGRELAFLGGEVIPEWGGVGSQANDYAGRPGKGFAKVLEDLHTEEWPVASYWRQTIVRSDNRIPALETDYSRYSFATPQEGGPVTLEAKLVFRRAFKPLADIKGWQIPDIAMEHGVVAINTSRWRP